MKRLLMLFSVILVSLAALSDMWTDPETGITWNYRIEDGVAVLGGDYTVRAVSTNITGNIVVPSMLGDIPVGGIGDQAFYECTGLERVTLPDSVKTVGWYAFWGCTNLVAIVVGEGNEKFSSQNGVLYNKEKHLLVEAPPGLPTITIADTAEVIGMGAFSGRRLLRDIVLPDSVTNIEYAAFFGCTNLKSVVFSSKLQTIGGYAFSGCSSLRELLLPDGLKYVGDAFDNCSSLNKVIIPNSVEYIRAYAFNNSTNILDATIPSRFLKSLSSVFCRVSALTIVGGSGCVSLDLFSDFTNLRNVVIADGPTSIGEDAFTNCAYLESVEIPKSITSVGDRAFYQCSSLREIIADGDRPDFGDDVFWGTPRTLTIKVRDNSEGWNDYAQVRLYSPWGFRTVEGIEMIESSITVSVITTNIVIHYIQTSEQSPMMAPVTNGVGLVNVMTEIKGGNVSIPESWVSNYPMFKTKFGNDFSTALTKTTGKKDAAGNPMCVWQDYVAGTDPTDETSVFRASVTMVAGKPVVSYTPELTAEEKAKRKYTTYGKVKLYDENWIEVPSGSEADYNFFKVTVEMR